MTSTQKNRLQPITIDMTNHKTSDCQREWLLTNGLGGFAMGSVTGCNTRRYHSLLIASRNPPVDRINTVSQIGETVLFDDQRHELFTMEFTSSDGGLVHPHGYSYLQRFEKQTTCKWIYHIGPIQLTKQLRLLWKRQIAIVEYFIEPLADSADPMPEQITLQLQPFVALRDFHSQRHDANPEQFSLSVDRRNVTLTSWELPTLQMATDHGKFITQPDTWHNIYYRADDKRGQGATEHLYCPGRFEHKIDTTQCDSKKPVLRFGAGVESIDWKEIKHDDSLNRHLAPLITQTVAGIKNKQARNEMGTTGTIGTLVAAANDFVVEREVDGKKMSTILAGYPWFADWGRDTFISLPGLLLCTGRFTEAKLTLLTYANHIKQGVIPNRFDDYGGEPHYNTVDASLWFIQSALEYLRVTGDKKTWKNNLRDACHTIIKAYRDGVPNDIHMDEDGLIIAGDDQTQLTWMDAKNSGIAFTPRHGKAVEINALWYNALTGFNKATKEEHPKLVKLTKLVKKSFDEVFWSDELGYLFDHVNEHGVDRSLRPNQAIAVSLPHSPLTKKKQQAVMQAISKQLLTPRGLRTLPQDDPNYHGRYEGSMFNRDKAYHQGTTWGWLIGPYVEGVLRANDFNQTSKKQARQAIAPLIEQLMGEGVGQLHEIFDGDAPHHPQGCPAQAWSIAELLRVYLLIEK